jgi:hypothetical protein
MEDLKNTFYKKINFIIKMVRVYSMYSVPEDWFDVAIANKDHTKTNKNGLHEYGTSFKIDSLISLYEAEFNNILSNYHIQYIPNKKQKVIIFKNEL